MGRVAIYTRVSTGEQTTANQADYDCRDIRAALLDGRSVRQAAKVTGASIGTIAAVRKELVAAGSMT